MFRGTVVFGKIIKLDNGKIGIVEGILFISSIIIFFLLIYYKYLNINISILSLAKFLKKATNFNNYKNTSAA